MPAFNVNAPKARPEGFAEATTVAGGRPRLTIKNGKFKADTVVIVDSNKSLAPFWEAMTKDAAQLCDALMQRDPNGIDIFFAGHPSDEPADHDSPAGGYLNVANPAYVHELFELVGTAGLVDEEAAVDTLDQVLSAYTNHYAKATDKADILPLNVLLWTDGEFDREALKRVFIKAAKALEAAGAPEGQAGVQLFRVGGVEGVVADFSFFDDGLKADTFGRDIVDHKPYVPSGLTEDNITGIATGAIDKAQD